MTVSPDAITERSAAGKEEEEEEIETNDG
jgi:hypothetical protein